MKTILMTLFAALLLAAIGLTVACSSDDSDSNNDNIDVEEVVPGTDHSILVAYFSEPLPNDVDAATSASRVHVNGDLYGSVQYVATVIGEATGSDMVRIQTVQPYPGNYDALAAQANQERQNNIYPELATNIENFENYDVIFVGYPIWWYQMPMAMYTFFDTYDFNGKTIIPFSTHGGSGWSGSLGDIAELEPNATIVTGYSISRNNTATSRNGTLDWLREINIIE